MKKKHAKRSDASERRVRWTVSLPAASARFVEERRKKEGLSRSAMVHRMITDAERERKKRELDAEIVAYYTRPRDPEDEALSKALGEAAKKLVIDDGGADW